MVAVMGYVVEVAAAHAVVAYVAAAVVAYADVAVAYYVVVLVAAYAVAGQYYAALQPGLVRTQDVAGDVPAGEPLNSMRLQAHYYVVVMYD